MTACPEERVDGALYCGSAGQRHIADNLAGRIRDLSDGTVIVTAGPHYRLTARALGPA